MYLITETTEDIQCTISESSEDSKKNYFIEGIFMQAEQKNRNGRIYPKQILTKEVSRYTKDLVENKRAMGKLGHPEGPSLNLERVSHLITELKENDNNIIGKAKILDTPYGKIVKNLIDEGAKLGVSSRGMGSIKPNKGGTNVVQEDFMLAAVDIVADPSAPDAFVNGIMEGKEWVWDNGILHSRLIENYKKAISESDKQILNKAKLLVFKHFLSNI
ncbi:TPA: primosomal protein [Candidatus Woesearchaeota archaeon]|nr:primosomal protein [Candidatus Woesearchaeota archaeon]